MNEFEQQLGSMAPAKGKSDPMQIMFLAGQQSLARPTPNGAGWWKLTSAMLTVVCLSLTACLFMQFQTRSPATIAKTDNSAKAQSVITDDADAPHQFTDRQVEPTLQNPATWKPLGPRIRHLRAVTQDRTADENESTSTRLSPFAFHRERTPSNF